MSVLEKSLRSKSLYVIILVSAIKDIILRFSNYVQIKLLFGHLLFLRWKVYYYSLECFFLE
jgi:hypothetical protein